MMFYHSSGKVARTFCLNCMEKERVCLKKFSCSYHKVLLLTFIPKLFRAVLVLHISFMCTLVHLEQYGSFLHTFMLGRTLQLKNQLFQLLNLIINAVFSLTLHEKHTENILKREKRYMVNDQEYPYIYSWGNSAVIILCWKK